MYVGLHLIVKSIIYLEHTTKFHRAPLKSQIENAYGVHSRMLLNVNLRVKADAKSGQLNYGNTGALFSATGDASE